MESEKIYVFASSSAGNSFGVKCGNKVFLFDIGISYKRLKEACAAEKLDMSEFKALFISHEHTDHISGLNVFLKRHNIPVYMTSGTYNGIKTKEVRGRKIIPDSSEINTISRWDHKNFGAVTVEVLPTVHDTNEPIAFFITTPHSKILSIMDTGYITQQLKSKALEADVLLLESNYDENLIRNHSSRPWAQRERVMSRYGHISNRKALDFLEEILTTAGNKLKEVILMHISSEHNRPEIIKKIFTAKLHKYNVNLSISLKKRQIVIEI